MRGRREIRKRGTLVPPVNDRRPTQSHRTRRGQGSILLSRPRRGYRRDWERDSHVFGAPNAHDGNGCGIRERQHARRAPGGAEAGEGPLPAERCRGGGSCPVLPLRVDLYCLRGIDTYELPILTHIRCGAPYGARRWQKERVSCGLGFPQAPRPVGLEGRGSLFISGLNRAIIGIFDR